MADEHDKYFLIYSPYKNRFMNFRIKQIYFFFAGIVLLSCSTAKQTKMTNATVHGFSNKVIAHRGAFKNTGVPENSIASLKAAIQLGCGGSEFDIHMTADSVLVINHDYTLQNLHIETSTYAALLEKSLSNGEKIPTLENYLKAGLGQTTTKLIAEIKPSKISKERSLALAEKVVAMVKQVNADPLVVYISFDYDILKKVQQLDAKASLQYLKGDIAAAQLKADGIDADYNYSIFQKDPNWIKNAKELGVVVNAWTVNNPGTMDSLLAQRVDFITTDEPELLLKKLAK
jgi:glycerophosphoryl diester phosphodiesterase